MRCKMRARDLGGAIVEESVVVMWALRLLQGAGATGALVGDFMAHKDALDFYYFHQEFRDATDGKEGIIKVGSAVLQRLTSPSEHADAHRLRAVFCLKDRARAVAVYAEAARG